jgi:beta-carotene hydroxylase
LARSRRQRAAELAWPPALVALFILLAANEVWIPAVVCLVAFFPRFGVAFHDLLHGSLRLSRRANRIWLSFIGLLALQSGHAIRAAHIAHHRRFPGLDDPEAYIGRLPIWKALLHGPTYQYRMWTFALRHHPELRRVVTVEATLHLTIVAGAIALVPTTPVPIVFALLVLGGDSIFPALSENLLHHQRGGRPQDRTRTIRGRLFEAYFLELGFHLEHHAYPAVPTRNCAELARRLEPELHRLGVIPLELP